MTPSPPEFAIDRCLGKRTPLQLRANGWRLVMIQDVFPDDAQQVADDEWLTWGNEHCDAALTKDKDIRRQPWFQVATIPIFSLSRQDLPIAEMISLFEMNRNRIHRIAAAHPGRQFWLINRTGDLRRTDTEAPSTVR